MRSRKKRRQKVVRRTAALAGDAGAEQAVRHAARHLVAAEHGDLRCDGRLRRHALLAIVVSDLQSTGCVADQPVVFPILCARTLRKNEELQVHTNRQVVDIPCQIRVP